MKKTWKVAFKDHGKRIDAFMSEITDLSRSQAKKVIEAGGFFVNGKLVSGHHALKEGDKITKEEQQAPKEPRRKTRRIVDDTVKISVKDLLIVKETSDWVAVYKPCGVLMHPDHAHLDGTLVDALIERDPGIAKIGEDPGRPGIMSRLDKDVSGLVVIAKTQKAFDDLKKQFGEHSVKKVYSALVYGEMEGLDGDIRFRIGRSTSKARMAAFPENSELGQAAWTHYAIAKRFKDATLLSIQILTGRTHQIRAHMLAMQHPIVGDILYKPKTIERTIITPRLLLQSTHLEFTDPASRERVILEIPLDQDFQDVLKTLK